MIVTVGPGRNFLTAAVVEGLVLKRGDAVVRPVASRFEPTTIDNAFGASKDTVIGRFQFELAAFTPEAGPLTFVCIGKTGNFEWTMTVDDLYALK